MSLTVKILSNTLGDRAAKARGGIADVVKATAFSIEADAKQRAPVDTGAL